MADITFVVAPIGGGKSLFATRALCKELKRTDRQIVTNLPLNMDSARDGYITVGEWAHEFVERPIDIPSRVRKLTELEVSQFWRYLPGKVLPMVEIVNDNTKDKRMVTDLESRQGDGGCLFIIDEVHLKFSARDWASIGIDVERYMSQLRKLNDDLMLITQHPEKVDKNFRRNATEWIYLENMGRKRLFAGVSLPRRFRYHIFPQMPVRNDKPTQSGWTRLEDEKYHLVYDTMAGVGLSGKLVPESNKSRGKHWVWWIIIILAVGVIGYMLPRLVARGSGMAMNGLFSQFGGGLGKLEPKLAPVASHTSSNRVEDVPAPKLSPIGETNVTQRNNSEVFMTGYAHFGGEWLVSLSDGRMLSSTDPDFQRLSEQGVMYAGKVYRKALFDKRTEQQKQSEVGKSVYGR